MNVAKIRGTEDKLDLRLRNFILNTLSKELSLYNFSEIETPILEQKQLICRSVGQETDIVTKEMFNVTSSGSEEICLRPEATASTTRAYLENKIVAQPWKVFSHGPMFRHERPQKGRWRQFDQFNIEVINGASSSHDIELLAMLDTLFKTHFKLTFYEISINFLGTHEERKNYRGKLAAFMQDNSDELCETCITRRDKNPIRALDCKSNDCQQIYLNAPFLTDSLQEESLATWKTIQDTLQTLSVNATINPRLVRGLDYYEGFVFEFSSTLLGAQNAFCAGGRYQLATALGAKKEAPAVGAAVGMGRLEMMIQTVADQLPIPQEAPLNIILPMTPDQHGVALKVAQLIRLQGKCVQVIVDKRKMQKMMQQANKLGAQKVFILGEEEQKANSITVKNMQSGDEQKIPQIDAAKWAA